MATERSWVIESGHGCFALFGATPVDRSDLAVGGTLVEWLDIGMGEPPMLIVKGGSQFGPYAVTLRQHDAEPPLLDEAEWEDVAEVSLVSAEELAPGALDDGPGEAVPVAAGTLRMRVGSRGRTEGAIRAHTFVDEDEAVPDDRDVPLEHFVLDLWAASGAPGRVLRETSQHAHDAVHPPEPAWPAEREPGLEAARRVASDLRGTGRHLSGSLGDAEVVVDVAGTPLRVYNRVKFASGWPPANGGILSEKKAVGDESRHYADPPDSDGLAPLLGMIETRVLEIDKPRRIALSWNWRVAGEDGRPYRNNPLLLREDATVVMSFAKISAAGEDARTRVTVRHSGVPAEWVDDLRALWTWEVVRYAEL